MHLFFGDGDSGRPKATYQEIEDVENDLDNIRNLTYEIISGLFDYVQFIVGDIILDFK